MILIIGGAYQGKLSFALEEYNISNDDICDLGKCELKPGFKCYTHFEELTKTFPEENISELSEIFKDSILISREICSGVVPIDSKDRLHREKHGRMLKILAKSSDTVIRVYCGIGQKLK